MTQFLDHASLTLITELGASAVRSLILMGVAAVALTVCRAKATSVRLFTWSTVLYASFALPLLGAFVPPLQISTPRYLRKQIAPTQVSDRRDVQSVFALATHSETSSYGAALPASYRDPKVSSTRERRSELGESAFRIRLGQRWNVIAAAIYLGITLFLIARFAAGIRWSHKLVRNSLAIPESIAIARVTSRAGQRMARLASCGCISVPLTVGVFRPTILLPSDWQEWGAEKLKAVLAHEFSHVVRRDALTQCVAMLHRAIFWFNPLAWWLNRHLAALGEQASDEAALSGGADQKCYARTLLDFLDALQTTPGRIRWQGVSMARTGQAEQRLERILSWKGTVAMKVKRSLAAAILVLAVPVVYLAAAVRPAQVSPAPSNADIAQQPGTPPAPPAPPAAPIGGVSAVAPVAGVPAVAPIAPIAPIAPVAPVAPSAPMALVGPGVSDHKSVSYHYGFDDEERFVIVSGKAGSFTMSGSAQDARHVEKLKKQIPGDFIWFQRDEKSYIIRDQATVDRARSFWAPQEELGRKQEELGKQQEELGKQQQELGTKMEQVRVSVPDMTAALDKLKAKLQKLGPTATMEQIGDLQSEIGELQSKLGEIQSQAGEQQGKLGELQGQLGEKQGKLGEQQGELGRQQAELSEKATQQMKELLDEAIKNGTAKPEEEIVKTATL